MVCSIQDKVAIPKVWILLDSQSTVDVFSNPRLLHNIHDVKRILVLYCNAGKAGDLKGYGTVWFHSGGIANTLSISNVQKKCKVMYNSTLNEGFLVCKGDCITWVYRPSKKVLFFSNVKDDAGHVFVNTVVKNKSKYTIGEYSDAVHVHSLQDIIGRPSTTDFIKYVENNMISNCPLQKATFYMLKTYLGQMLDHSKAKQLATTIIYLPTGMLEQHGNVTIEMDIMYINKVPYFVMTLHGIHFGTVELLKTRNWPLLPHQ